MSAPMFNGQIPSPQESLDDMYEPSYGDVAMPVGQKPIDKLGPGSELHKKVLGRLKDRIEFSEDYMRKFYSRWAVNESKIQAYVNLPDWEQALKDMNDSNAPPHPVRLIVPFGYAAQATMVTFLIHTFAGQNPMFQIGANDPNYVQNARNAELVLQYNADHCRLVRSMWQGFNDIGLYGVQAWETGFESKYAYRTTRVPQPIYGGLPDSPPQMTWQKTRAKKLVYQGNTVSSIDPFMFLPDPRVPMSKVNREGEFVFVRSFQSKMKLKADDDFKWVDKITNVLPRTRYPQDSKRATLSRGVAFPGGDDAEVSRRSTTLQSDFVQIDEGTVLIVPKEWGLGDSDEMEMWKFAVGNKDQIIQAEPYECDHGMHPVSVSEPYGLGSYSFGNPGPADFIGPLQDIITWLVNSHMENVRAVLNDMWVVDPSRVEMGDLKQSGPGKRIRLKPSAYGTDVRQSLMQLPIIDVTTGHMKDAELFMRIGMMLLGMNENVMGQNASTRRTATESRQSAEAAVSRLAQTARVISAQSFTDLTEQMVLNLQQHMDMEFYISVLGPQGAMEGMMLNPGDIAGDFHYPIHDGTLPLDRIALLDVWKQIMQGALADPEIRQAYDVPKMFEWICKLGGAQNIASMKKSPQQQAMAQMQAQPEMQDQGQIDEQVRKGDAVPVGSPGLNPGVLAGLSQGQQLPIAGQ